MPSEFDIIRQYFMLENSRDDVSVGIGDDAAVLSVPAGYQLVQSMDTLVAGVHFPLETSAGDIAYKSLAVNLSDMAAMGATPAWFTLAITLPDDDSEWLQSFSKSLAALAQKYNLQLVGGDTTHGPLCISICINGFIPTGTALLRKNANVKDKVYVSGTIGDAALALVAWQGQYLLRNDTTYYLNKKLNRPEPQVELGLLLRDYASACIDISDGLAADLGHILQESKLGATIYFEKIPLSNEFKLNVIDDNLAIPLVLSGGDDYQLCFTVRAEKQSVFEKIVNEKNIKVECIGEIESVKGLRCLLDNVEIDIHEAGYQHFSSD
ncbi:MAG: thiamine-phosphate kinase [Gammaproteobacteria bacterium]|nr:thiamine-phosphate kinase [Gammaproteobacteria bacterium]